MQEFAPSPQLGPTLRRAREVAGLSVRQLAEQLGIAKSVVSRLELGERNTVKPVVLMRMAQALELPARQLFRLAGIPFPNDKPSLPAMLRAEYDVPPEAIAEMQQELARVAQKYRNRKPVSEEI